MDGAVHQRFPNTKRNIQPFKVDRLKANEAAHLSAFDCNQPIQAVIQRQGGNYMVYNLKEIEINQKNKIKLKRLFDRRKGRESDGGFQW
jgi:hypothetical protein